MSPNRVFLDSGIFIAALNRRDQHHGQARLLFGGSRPDWYTSALVWSEAYSWFLHRHGEEAARSFRRMVESLDDLTVFDTTRVLHRATCRLLDRLRGTRLTYVDASSLVLIEEHRIKTVWSTDHHLGLTGARVRPAG